jgi:hypothetical protein
MHSLEGSHRCKVGIELGFILVIRYKHHLELFGRGVAFVKFAEKRSKCPARRTKMAAEVEHYDLPQRG